MVKESPSENPFKHFLDNSFYLIWIINCNGKLEYANPAWYEALGHLEDNLAQDDIYTFIHPATKPVFQETLAQVLQGQSVQGLEISLVRKNNEPIIIMGDVHPHKVASKIVGGQFIFTDITAQRLIEDKWQTAERQLQFVLSHIDEVFFLFDVTNQKILNINTAYERIFGQPTSKLNETPFSFLDYIHPEDRNKVLENMAQSAQQPGVIRSDYRIVRSDGEIRWVSDATYSLEDYHHKIHQKISIITDITDRKTLEQSLRQSTARLDAINNISRRLLAAQSVKSIARTVLNHLDNLIPFQQAQIFQYHTQTEKAKVIAAVGKEGILQMLGNQFFSSAPLGISKQSRNIQIQYVEDIFVLPLSSPFYQELAQENIRSFILATLVADGITAGVLFIAADTSHAYDEKAQHIVKELAELLAIAFQQLHLRESLRDYTETLESLVANRTYALQIANKELVQANRLKDEFLAAMSHELRTPLTNILARAEILQDMTFGELNEKQVSSLRTIEQNGNQLLALITDIMDLANLNAGQIVFQQESTSLDLICESSLAAIRESARVRRLRIKEAYVSGLTITTDSRRLLQIVVNLLSNAVKFTPPEGEIGLTVTVDEAKQEVQIAVCDTGIGISQAQMKSLFNPFVQLDGGLTRRQGGTGLGLVLVDRLTSSLGGRCMVASEVDTGSVFTVIFPMEHLND